MRTGNRKLCRKFFPTGQRCIRQAVVDHIKRAVLVQRGCQVARRVVDTVGHNAAAKFFPFVPQKRLVTAQNGAAVRLQALEDLELCLADTLARAKELNVRGANVGDDRDIRLCCRRHARQLAEVVHAHFSHHDLGISRHAK